MTTWTRGLTVVAALTGVVAAGSTCNAAGEILERLLQPKDQQEQRLFGKDESVFRAGETIKLEIVNEGLQLNVHKWARDESKGPFGLFGSDHVTGATPNPVATWQSFPILLLGEESQADAVRPSIDAESSGGLQILVTEGGTSLSGSSAFAVIDGLFPGKAHVVPPKRPSTGAGAITTTPATGNPEPLTIAILPPKRQLSSAAHDKRFSLWAAMPRAYMSLNPQYCIPNELVPGECTGYSTNPVLFQGVGNIKSLTLHHYDPVLVGFSPAGCDQIGEEGHCSQGALRLRLLEVDTRERVDYVDQRLRASQARADYVRNELIDYWLTRKIEGCPNCVVVRNNVAARTIADAIVAQYKSFGALATAEENQRLIGQALEIDSDNISASSIMIDLKLEAGDVRAAQTEAKRIYAKARQNLELALAKKEGVTAALGDLAVAARAVGNVWPRIRVGISGDDIAYAVAVLRETIAKFETYYNPAGAKSDDPTGAVKSQYASLIADLGHLYLRTRRDRDLDRATENFARALIETPRRLNGAVVAVSSDQGAFLSAEVNVYGADQRLLSATQMQFAIAPDERLLGRSGTNLVVFKPEAGAPGKLRRTGVSGAPCQITGTPISAVSLPASSDNKWLVIISESPSQKKLQSISFDTGACKVGGSATIHPRSEHDSFSISVKGDLVRVLYAGATKLLISTVDATTGDFKEILQEIVPAGTWTGGGADEAKQCVERGPNPSATMLCDVALRWDADNEFVVAARTIGSDGSHVVTVSRYQVDAQSGDEKKLKATQTGRPQSIAADFGWQIGLPSYYFAGADQRISLIPFVLRKTGKPQSAGIAVIAPAPIVKAGLGWTSCNVKGEPVDSCFIGNVFGQGKELGGAAATARIVGSSSKPWPYFVVGVEDAGASSCPLKLLGLNVPGLTATVTASSKVPEPNLVQDPAAALRREASVAAIEVPNAVCGGSNGLEIGVGAGAGPLVTVQAPVRELDTTLSNYSSQGRQLGRWRASLPTGASTVPLAQGLAVAIKLPSADGLSFREQTLTEFSPAERVVTAPALVNLPFLSIDVPTARNERRDGLWVSFEEISTTQLGVQLVQPKGVVTKLGVEMPRKLLAAGRTPGGFDAERIVLIGREGEAAPSPAATASLNSATLIEVVRPEAGAPSLAKRNIDLFFKDEAKVLGAVPVDSARFLTIERTDKGLALNLRAPGGPVETMGYTLAGLNGTDLLSVYVGANSRVVVEVFKPSTTAKSGAPPILKAVHSFDLKVWTPGVEATPDVSLDALVEMADSPGIGSGLVNAARPVLVAPDATLLSGAVPESSQRMGCVALRLAPGKRHQQFDSYPAPALAAERVALIGDSSVVTTGPAGTEIWPRIPWPGSADDAAIFQASSLGSSALAFSCERTSK
ncbi:hypothetical protein LRP30_16135 [Bradyrhizobium sp. C-145]|uniref:hypothetical protein n=1 Tax=Bradyrhizobium sp. C-145 TaxID=574727 RepID=UPI00201B5420|nr:hypothetical protein [Bradyrhizobium sp. C-145]UQR66684.1 hypothetical protein LRP30_16135 [Bradyrhizobium sp. C-145]